MISLFQQHVNKWKNCTDCPLCEVRTKVVLARGKIGCDLLFIGEAPGPSEDSVGSPFIGPAGSLLDRMIAQAIPEHIRVAFTNTVACFPRLTAEEKEREPTKKYRDPNEVEIKACHNRLVEFVRICQPKVLVLLGQVAKKAVYGEAMFSESGDGPCGWLSDGEFIKFYDIIHPAAILKADITKQELMARRCVVTLEEAVSRL